MQHYIAEATHDLYPSPITNYHTFFDPSLPWSTTYFMDGL